MQRLILSLQFAREALEMSISEIMQCWANSPPLVYRWDQKGSYTLPCDYKHDKLH